MSADLSFSLLRTRSVWFKLTQQGWAALSLRVSQQRLKINSWGRANMSSDHINHIFINPPHIRDESIKKKKNHSQSFPRFRLGRIHEGCFGIIVNCWHNSLKWLPTSVRQESWVYFGCCRRIDSPPLQLKAIESFSSWECLPPCSTLVRVSLIRVRGQRSTLALLQNSFNWHRAKRLSLGHEALSGWIQCRVQVSWLWFSVLDFLLLCCLGLRFLVLSVLLQGLLLFWSASLFTRLNVARSCKNDPSQSRHVRHDVYICFKLAPP